MSESAEASCCSQAYKERRSSLTVKDSETSDSVIVSVFIGAFWQNEINPVQHQLKYRFGAKKYKNQ